MREERVRGTCCFCFVSVEILDKKSNSVEDKGEEEEEEEEKKEKFVKKTGGEERIGRRAGVSRHVPKKFICMYRTEHEDALHATVLWLVSKGAFTERRLNRLQ